MDTEEKSMFYFGLGITTIVGGFLFYSNPVIVGIIPIVYVASIPNLRLKSLYKKEINLVNELVDLGKEIEYLEEVVANEKRKLTDEVTQLNEKQNFEELAVYPKGYRILNKVPRMPNSIVEKLVKSFKSFQHILVAEINELDKVEGIGNVRARTIKQTLKKMQEQFAFDNILI